LSKLRTLLDTIASAMSLFAVCPRWPAGCYLGFPRSMILLRTLAMWVGCGVASILTAASTARCGLFDNDESHPLPERSTPRPNRIATLQFVEPQIESTPLTLKGPQL
jgi:hypothetical protein